MRSVMGGFGGYAAVLEVSEVGDHHMCAPPLSYAHRAWDARGLEHDHREEDIDELLDEMEGVPGRYSSAVLMDSAVFAVPDGEDVPQPLQPLTFPRGSYCYTLHRCPFMTTPRFCFLLLFSVLWTGIGAVVVATAWIVAVQTGNLAAKMKLP